jgi:predicted metal-dependent HD superfamily phosphohydrolase
MTQRTEHSREQAKKIKVQYWPPLAGRHKPGAWETLDAGYTEQHRAYHTWDHIAGLFERLSEFSELATRPDIIALSTLWHDVVYRTENCDGTPRQDYENVRDSAELFRQYTLLNQPDADAVYDLIMATAGHVLATAKKQHYAGFSGDFDLFLDLDLSSLAAPWEEFIADFARIRFEFSSMPEITFCSKQIQILENFAREDVRLYRRAATSGKWHDAARANLKRCVADLKKRVVELSPASG